ncbi:DNA cytosine methyltransferase [Tessaracoccus sp. Z1128]
MTPRKLWSAEICAGAGGQALGLEQAGFEHRVCVEWEHLPCETLRLNRPEWHVVEADLREWDGHIYRGKVDLFAGGVPCPPYSVASKQLGEDDERNLFPRALELVAQIEPKAVMLENVRGLLDPKFSGVRDSIDETLRSMGYNPRWQLLNASHYGVSQLRPRVILVAMRDPWDQYFAWPAPNMEDPITVGELLRDDMAVAGWEGADAWAQGADGIAPTLVGGSTKHGGPDLGPTRARAAWKKLGVNGGSLAPEPPEPGFVGLPRLTVDMAARVQGFPREWRFAGAKTAAYRQVGNALPPPVARAVGLKIAAAIRRGDKDV